MPYDEKVKVLLWITGLQLNVEDIKLIPDDIILDIFICLYLVKNQAMKTVEAECLMQSIIDVHHDKADMMKYPKNVNERAFQIGFLFTKLFVIVHSCISAVGLKIFQVN